MINNIQNYSYVQQEKMISELKEKLHCAIQKSIFNSDYINSNEYFELKIRRLIETDQMILEFVYVNGHSGIDNISIKSTIDNNEIVFNKINYPNKTVNIFQAILPTLANWKSFTFDKFKNIYFDIFNVTGKKHKSWEKLYSLNYKFQFDDINQQELKIKDEGTKISLLSTIKLKFYNSENLIESLEDNSDYEYLITELKPSKLEIGKHIENFYDISMYKKWSNSKRIKYDLDKTDYSGFEVKNETTNDLISGKFNLKSYGENNIKAIKTVSYSYYDKTKKKTIISSDNELAQKGLIIPLNFQGNFNHRINLSFGKNIKNIILNYNHLFKKPFFSSTNGLIKLNYIFNDNYVTNKNITWNLIKYKNIHKIHKENLTLDEIKIIGKE